MHILILMREEAYTLLCFLGQVISSSEHSINKLVKNDFIVLFIARIKGHFISTRRFLSMALI
jgi:hypothetical protein